MTCNKHFEKVLLPNNLWYLQVVWGRFWLSVRSPCQQLRFPICFFKLAGKKHQIWQVKIWTTWRHCQWSWHTLRTVVFSRQPNLLKLVYLQYHTLNASSNDMMTHTHTHNHYRSESGVLNSSPRLPLSTTEGPTAPSVWPGDRASKLRLLEGWLGFRLMGSSLLAM